MNIPERETLRGKKERTTFLSESSAGLGYTGHNTLTFQLRLHRGAAIDINRVMFHQDLLNRDCRCSYYIKLLF